LIIHKKINIQLYFENNKLKHNKKIEFSKNKRYNLRDKYVAE